MLWLNKDLRITTEKMSVVFVHPYCLRKKWPCWLWPASPMLGCDYPLFLATSIFWPWTTFSLRHSVSPRQTWQSLTMNSGVLWLSGPSQDSDELRPARLSEVGTSSLIPPAQAQNRSVPDSILFHFLWYMPESCSPNAGPTTRPHFAIVEGS